jgi:drug/metabolite transporter (DMT)-like permease
MLVMLTSSRIDYARNTDLFLFGVTLGLGAALVNGIHTSILRRLGNRVHSSTIVLTMGLSSTILGILLMPLLNISISSIDIKQDS